MKYGAREGHRFANALLSTYAAYEGCFSQKGFTFLRGEKILVKTGD